MRCNKRVLVVDDNPVNVMVLEEMLGSEYRLESAQNGQEAIEIAGRFQPAVILLDVMMPGMDGLETCRRLRETPGLSSTNIIMLSAKAMPSEQVEGMDAGADDYITKPFDEVDLLDLLRKSTTRGQRIDEDMNWSEPPPGQIIQLF